MIISNTIIKGLIKIGLPFVFGLFYLIIVFACETVHVESYFTADNMLSIRCNFFFSFEYSICSDVASSDHHAPSSVHRFKFSWREGASNSGPACDLRKVTHTATEGYVGERTCARYGFVRPYEYSELAFATVKIRLPRSYGDPDM